jgi:hypothetical protein
MFKKHRGLVVAIVLGAIVLCIGGKIGMDYKKDYDWQQEKNRQLAVAKFAKSKFENITEISFNEAGKYIRGAGTFNYEMDLNQNGANVSVAGIVVNPDGEVWDGYSSFAKNGVTKKDIQVNLSDGEKVTE